MNTVEWTHFTVQYINNSNTADIYTESLALSVNYVALSKLNCSYGVLLRNELVHQTELRWFVKAPLIKIAPTWFETSAIFPSPSLYNLWQIAHQTDDLKSLSSPQVQPPGRCEVASSDRGKIIAISFTLSQQDDSEKEGKREKDNKTRLPRSNRSERRRESCTVYSQPERGN